MSTIYLNSKTYRVSDQTNETYEWFLELEEKLHQKGIEIYAVGGWVRDILLGREPKDIDVVVSTDIKEAVQSLEDIKEFGISNEFTRYLVYLCSYKGRHFELVQFRSEEYDEDSRKPTTKPGTIKDDSERRDFTINSLYYGRGGIVDPTFRGLNDLEDGIIRACNDPTVIFKDDPLRMLRAVRLASELDFQIEDRTLMGIKKNVHRLYIISKERIAIEMTKLLVSQGVYKGLQLLWETGLLNVILPELSRLSGLDGGRYHFEDPMQHTFRVCSLVEPTEELRWAALLHDTGKFLTQAVRPGKGMTFYEHEDYSADISREVLERLKMPNRIITRVSKLCQHHGRALTSNRAIKRTKRIVGDEDFPLLLNLMKADKASKTGLEVDIISEEVFESVMKAPTKVPLDGNEILEIVGRSPGPWIGNVKRALEDMVDSEELDSNDKEAAKTFILSKMEDPENVFGF